MTGPSKLLLVPAAHPRESLVVVLDIVREAADSLQPVAIMLKATTAIPHREMPGLWKLEGNQMGVCRNSAFAC